MPPKKPPLYYIFRSYDIRGVYNKDITEYVMRLIGNAIAQSLNSETIVVARDARLSSESLNKAFIQGFTETGKNIIDVGEVPNGVALFYSTHKQLPCAYITASHLGPEWNGIKFYDEKGIGFIEKENYKLREMVLKQQIISGSSEGFVMKENSSKIIEKYKNYLLFRIKADKKLRIIIDCGNGTAGHVVADLFRRAGYDVCIIFEKPDGNFPNRSSDPDEKNSLEKLSELVKGYDIGFAFDGDSDRLVVVDNEARKLSAEQVGYIMIDEISKVDKGPVIVNVECTKLAEMAAKSVNKKIFRIPVGHTFMMRSVYEKSASIGFESSGHYCIRHVFPFDDAIAVSLYFAMVISRSGKSLNDIVEQLPVYAFDRINIECPEDKKFTIIKNLKNKISKKYNNITVIDGIRIDFEKGWVLMRASNTSPCIKITVEAETFEDLEKTMKKFSEIIKKEIK